MSEIDAVRLLQRAVHISICYLALAKTDADYARIYDDNRARFYNACVAAALLVEPTPT